MAQAPTPAPPPAPEPAKKPKKKSGGKKLLMVIAAVVFAGLGAGGWLWHRSASAQAKPDDAADTAEVKSVLHLESFVVNLQGGSDSGYLRVGIDLGLGVAQQGEGQKDVVAPLRDTILTVLGSQNVDTLLTPTGKAKLKEQILAAINQRLPEIECRDVYFTDFLVQH
jgi:flagellar protein FliL